MGILPTSGTIIVDVDTTTIESARAALVELQRKRRIDFNVYADGVTVAELDTEYYTAQDTLDAIAGGGGGGGVVHTDDSLDGTGAEDEPLAVVRSGANPAALGVASPGVSNASARADHVHTMPNAAAVGADPAGTAATESADAIAAHVAALNPHPQYQLATVIPAISGFLASGTPGLRVCYAAGADTVARGADEFSIGVLFNLLTMDAGAPQTFASCYNGSAGYTLRQDGSQLLFSVVNATGTVTASCNFNQFPVSGNWVWLMGTYSGSAGSSLINLYMNGYNIGNAFAGADGTFVPAVGTLFTIGAREAGASDACIRGRIAGASYWASTLFPDVVANTYEAIRTAGYVVNGPTAPTNQWRIQNTSSYPAATWTASVGAANLNLVGASATNTTLAPYWR